MCQGQLESSAIQLQESEKIAHRTSRKDQVNFRREAPRVLLCAHYSNTLNLSTYVDTRIVPWYTKIFPITKKNVSGCSSKRNKFAKQGFRENHRNKKCSCIQNPCVLGRCLERRLRQQIPDLYLRSNASSQQQLCAPVQLVYDFFHISAVRMSLIVQ